MGAKRTGTGSSGTSKDGLTKAGRIGKLFGIDGGLTLSLYDNFPGEINIEEPLWVIVDSLAVPFFAEHFERRGRSGALVRFADIDTTQRAEEFIGQEVYLRNVDEEESDGQLYFEDIEGFTAIISEDGSKALIKGAITAYVDNEFNPLFAVETASGEEILIPASEDFIVKVDIKKREIKFLLPEGLLGLND